MKAKNKEILREAPKIVVVALSVLCLIIFPSEIGNGIKKGLSLSGETLIPALFPFMILSSYIAASPIFIRISKLMEKPSRFLFNVSGEGFISIMLGTIGGYPIGPKTVSELYETGIISKEDSHRLLCWCINPSPSFVITAIGTFMLGNTKSGVLIFLSNLLASFVIGFFVRFTGKEAQKITPSFLTIKNTDAFISSVSSGSKAMLSVCGWVLTFSAISSALECIIGTGNFSIFIKAMSEVTTGCNSVSQQGFSLPVLSAVTGFGGLAVIFQIAPYVRKCCYDLKAFICMRLLNGALSAFICTGFCKLFPQTTDVLQVLNIGNARLELSHSLIATIFLLITCILLILEVDNKGKVC